MSSFDPQIPNQPVRHLFNPSLHGITTGRTRQLGTTLHVQVQININDIRYLPFDELDANIASVKGIEDLLDLCLINTLTQKSPIVFVNH